MRKSVLLAVVLLVLGVSPAWAHVEVSPETAAKGETTTFTFSVPNEEAPAKTTAVEFLWPEDVTFARVSPVEKPGWTATTSERSVKWSGGAIGGEEEETFNVTLGPLPNNETITFKALQTYDNGEVVRWIGAAKTDNPAPVVTLTGPAVTTTQAPVATTTKKVLNAEEKNDSDDKSAVTTIVIVAAFVLAGIGVGIAISARRRAPKP